MTILNIHETKTNLSRLLVEVAKGKEIIIAKAGNPIAKLVPITVETKNRTGNQLKGKISIAKDFDELPETFMKHFS